MCGGGLRLELWQRGRLPQRYLSSTPGQGQQWQVDSGDHGLRLERKLANVQNGSFPRADLLDESLQQCCGPF